MNHALAQKVRGRCVNDAPMARYSSWRVGGIAETLFFPEDIEDLAVMLSTLEADVPVHMVGLGSNLLVRDGGIDGVVVRTAPGLTEIRDMGDNTVYAQAGVAMPKLARFAAQNGHGGAGFMAGVPGTVGGALSMNAGCFGSSTWERVRKVVMIAPGGKTVEAAADEFEVGYRHVRHRTLDPVWFVAAEFKFPPRQEYEDEKDREMMARRDATQPIGTANAGSVFTNPDGDSAGRLIEAAGLAGHKVGDAQVSEKHCNFIVNLGNATAADIEDLINEVHDATLVHSGVDLNLEVRIIGDRA